MKGQRWKISFKFSSLEKLNLYTNDLGAKKTILPSSIQRNHNNAITEIKGQECLPLPGKDNAKRIGMKMNEEQDIKSSFSAMSTCLMKSDFSIISQLAVHFPTVWHSLISQHLKFILRAIIACSVMCNSSTRVALLRLTTSSALPRSSI